MYYPSLQKDNIEKKGVIYQWADRDNLIRQIVHAINHDDWSGWDYAEIEQDANTGKLCLYHHLDKKHESIVIINKFEVKLNEHNNSVNLGHNEGKKIVDLFCVVP